MSIRNRWIWAGTLGAMIAADATALLAAEGFRLSPSFGSTPPAASKPAANAAKPPRTKLLRPARIAAADEEVAVAEEEASLPLPAGNRTATRPSANRPSTLTPTTVQPPAREKAPRSAIPTVQEPTSPPQQSSRRTA